MKKKRFILALFILLSFVCLGTGCYVFYHNKTTSDENSIIYKEKEDTTKQKDESNNESDSSKQNDENIESDKNSLENPADSKQEDMGDSFEEQPNLEKENTISNTKNNENHNTSSSNKNTNSSKNETSNNSSSQNVPTSSKEDNEVQQETKTCQPKKFAMSWVQADIESRSKCEEKAQEYLNEKYIGYTCAYYTDDCGDIYFSLELYDGDGNLYDYHSL